MAGFLVGALVGALVAAAAAAWAFHRGVRRGQAAERDRNNRFVHDTALQGLEAIALLAAPGTPTGPDRVAEIHRIARAGATELRASLTAEATSGRPARLGQRLGSAVVDLARDGLRAQLIMGEVDDVLQEPRCLALDGAVREALRNTLRHAATDRAVVRVREHDSGIEVTVRDHGAGFDPATTELGFGISQSILARLREVGGRADIVSTRGRGTLVTLWAPR
ncbi:Histidine kinase-like ATPase domain-containing protein [Streptoalloteichus tenebrarius]|uniref:Histidine kinase-like ATPase domain-containing protein n=1 Tax=Streptoalloteichus tenebrarius (strain ATCC 17920 / DSM 40477 / JCM 4838 / CBS 697.72 / NBRC 16177 / NCIMB 11028 / NRRL B-12390 / A12253. 1 / ISP 5477) TaxID=1933 RepID=A0ABT1HV11_STRSD|nr:ATP-binding protein [Streptoalloteichus tenebrarius]MCP2259312.1 Histidine kinase-like ATPase domain-containing protein [Streptoalloteichus tenebrarius]BFE99075.1 hypothetical protein GCM10020241_07510 [Streptoalloteichus tenebrarius]